MKLPLELSRVHHVLPLSLLSRCFRRFEIVVGTDGVPEPPVKVGSGFTNAQGVYLIYGQWLTGHHVVVVDAASGFNKPSPAQVGSIDTHAMFMCAVKKYKRSTGILSTAASL